MRALHGWISLMLRMRLGPFPDLLDHEIAEHGYALGIPHFFGIDEIGLKLWCLELR